MFRSALVMVAAIAFATAGCGSTGGTNNNNNGGDTVDLAMAPPPPDMSFDPGPYPADNFGTAEGKTVYNVKAKGYMLSRAQQDVSQLYLQDIALEVIRNDPRCKCLLLSESATWCGPCNAEQPELVKAVEEDPSFCVFNVLVDGPTRGTRATNDDVQNWGAQHTQNFPIVAANQSTYGRLPRPDFLPTNVIINPRTMEILSINAGLGPTTIDDAKALCAASQ